MSSPLHSRPGLTKASLMVLLASLWLAGCGSPANREAMVPTDINAARPHPYSVSVLTSGGADTG
ncbi:MAG TPA: hypothetical protein PKZ19_11415, partial [Zoogloea sp.]|nr:hypothetical protein [Zoogloea sp.]